MEHLFDLQGYKLMLGKKYLLTHEMLPTNDALNFSCVFL